MDRQDTEYDKLSDEEKITLHDDVIKAHTQARDRLVRKHGPSGADTAERLRRDEEAATAFEKMTPMELMELRERDPEEWGRVLASHQAVGTRRLMKNWR